MLVERKQTKILKEDIGHVGVLLETAIVRSNNLVVRSGNVTVDDTRGDVTASVQLRDKGRGVHFFFGGEGDVFIEECFKLIKGTRQWGE